MGKWALLRGLLIGLGVSIVLNGYVTLGSLEYNRLG